MKKKIHHWAVGIEKPVKPVVPLESFGVLARVNDQKSILKSLLRFCICRWCSVYWLQEFKK